MYCWKNIKNDSLIFKAPVIVSIFKNSSLGLIFSNEKKWNLSSTRIKETNHQCLSVPPLLLIIPAVTLVTEEGDCSVSNVIYSKATYKRALRAHCPENSICKCSTMYGQKFKDYCLMYEKSRVLWKSVHSKSGKHFQTSREWFRCWGCMWQNLSVSAPVFCYHPWTVTDFKPATRISFELTIS